MKIRYQNYSKLHAHENTSSKLIINIMTRQSSTKLQIIN